MITTLGHNILIHNLWKLTNTSLGNVFFFHLLSQKSKKFNIKFNENESKIEQGRFHKAVLKIASNFRKKSNILDKKINRHTVQEIFFTIF